MYAIDRRGHGSSSKPEDAYHFLDFSEDIVAVIDELGLTGAYGVGHSAGATDVLLAATSRPNAFSRIFAMEPTVMDPATGSGTTTIRSELQDSLSRTSRRRMVFPDFGSVMTRYGSRSAFQNWRAELLEIYVRSGFEERTDGSVELRCTPVIETAMLVHIYAAVDGLYRGDVRGQPFGRLREIPSGRCCISTADWSSGMYRDMAKVGLELIPGTRTYHFRGAGHSVAQEKPEEVVEAVLAFWKASD